MILFLFVDNNSPRGRWLLGRVVKTFPGQDRRVRVAEIKTKNSTLVRPISKLCLLEEAVHVRNFISTNFELCYEIAVLMNCLRIIVILLGLFNPRTFIQG